MATSPSGQSSTAELALFPDMNPDPVLRTDRSATIILANAAARAVLGDVVQQGRCWKDVCPGLTEPLWQQILDRKEVVQVEGTLAGSQCVFSHRRSDAGDLVFVYGSDVTQLRRAEEGLRQSEKMASLGTIAAGVAHELNNPAAAATRGASQLRDALAGLQGALMHLTRLGLDDRGIDRLLALAQRDQERDPRPADLDPLERSDRETVVEEWLAAHAVPQPWAVAGALVSLGYGVQDLEELAREWEHCLPAVAAWIGRAQPVLGLVREIERSTRRISDIVQALKSYSYLGQASVGDIDIVASLDSTLVMLQSQLVGVRVQKEYGAGVPAVYGDGSELNQVWTSLLDNAAKALDGRGTITLRVRREGDVVAVDIEDDGPGIPPALQSKVFDPFFTTRAPGQGAGLGLSTSRNIVERRHGGSRTLGARPGTTCFIVRLPLHRLASEGATPA